MFLRLSLLLSVTLACAAQTAVIVVLSSTPAQPSLGQETLLTATVQSSEPGLVLFTEDFRVLGAVVKGSSTSVTLKFRFQQPGRRNLRASFASASSAASGFSPIVPLSVTHVAINLFAGGSSLPSFDYMLDANLDGLPDLIKTGGSEIRVYLGNGNGTFQSEKLTPQASIPAPLYLARFGDVDGDGIPDAILPGGFLKGMGTGTFASTYVASPNLQAGILADINLDGKTDVLASTFLLGNNAGAFTPVPGLTLPGQADLTPSRLNNDNSGDALMLNGNLCSAAISSGPSWALSTCSQDPFNRVFATDLDGDGLTDAVAQSYATGFKSLLNTGSGFTAVAAGVPQSAFVTVNDINGDGKADLVRYLDNAVYTHAGNGNGTFQAATLFAATSALSGHLFELVELTGDGRPDLLVWLNVNTSTSGAPVWVQTLYPGADSTGSNLSPLTAAMTPGIPTKFDVTFSGAGGGGIGYLLLNATAATGGCLVEVDSTHGTFRLRQGPMWSARIKPGSGVLANDVCYVFGSGSSITSVGGALLASIPVALSADGSNLTKSFLQAAPSSGTGTGYIEAGSVSLSAVPPPSPTVTSIVSFSPVSGSAPTVIYQLTASTPRADIRLVNLLINSTIAGANGCLIEVNVLDGSLRLLNNAGSGWSAPVTIGTPGLLSNAQCTLDPAIVTLSLQGTSIYVQIPIAFAGAWAGPRSVYGLFQSGASNTSTGWIKLGNWTVSNSSIPSQPQVVSLTPPSGLGRNATFTGVFRNPAGASQLYLAYMLFLPIPNVTQFTAAGSCLVEYNRISNGVRLINNAGTDWIGPVSGEVIRPNAPALANDTCAVNVAQMTAAIDGASLTIKVPVMFAVAIKGVLGTFLQGFDLGGAYTGMTQFGNWVSQHDPAPRSPAIVSFSPSTSNGPLYSPTVEATNGDQLSLVSILVGNAISDPAPCQVLWTLNPAAPRPGVPRMIWMLIDDTGTVALTGTTAISNSRCTLDVTGSVITTSNGMMRVQPKLTFSPAFTGSKNVYSVAFDFSGLTTHWVQGGVLTNP